MDFYQDNDQQETKALRSLIEISHQGEDKHAKYFKKKVHPKKQKYMHRKSVTKPLFTQVSLGKAERQERLPLIINKSNLDRPSPLTSSNQKMSHCVLFDKGLGLQNSVQIQKGKKKDRYFENSNNFIRFYSQSNESEFEMIKNWLVAKKRSCKSLKEISTKRKNSQSNPFQEISIKHIL